jgi:hypothetical protein
LKYTLKIILNQRDLVFFLNFGVTYYSIEIKPGGIQDLDKSKTNFPPKFKEWILTSVGEKFSPN